MLLVYISKGLLIGDAVAPERDTLKRHAENMGQLAFLFGVELKWLDGIPHLVAINPEHEIAAKAIARVSTLCRMGEEVAKKVARAGGFDEATVIAMGRSGGYA